uniref:Transposase, Ptta/En/Spm, plant n=1 Tax=Nicotiana tabacum TaxID=4097 RepID=A0A1S3YLG7_TOBAC
MTRGRGTKRSWGGRGGMSNKGGEGYQQLPNTSHANISEPSPPTSQQVGSKQHIISSHESSFRQLIRTSQDVHAQQTTSASQNVGGQQATPASLNIGHQQAPRSSQDVGYQQETHSQDVSAKQTLASYGSSNPQARRDTTRGIISLKVNGDTFCPHEAVRNVTTAFKKSFSGSWHCWSKVPEHVRDRWFNDFEKKYSFPSKDKVFIRWTFEHVGSERLSDSLGKAKRQFSKTKEIPGWIAKDHWDVLMEYWNSENFTKKSEINSKNRMSSNNGEGPSLHTGGSVAFAEYRRRHKEITGKDLRNNELFLKSHRTKNEKKWICGKSERMW